MTDANDRRGRRWSDITSDSSDDEVGLCPPPIQNLDDSYNGPPASNCGDSNSGLNAALKEKCSAAGEDKVEEETTDSKSTSEPSDFGFLANTIRSEKYEQELMLHESQFRPSFSSQDTRTSSSSGCFGMFPVANFRSVTEFYPTLSSSVMVVDNMKRQLSVCSETGKPKRKHRRKSKKTADVPDPINGGEVPAASGSWPDPGPQAPAEASKPGHETKTQPNGPMKRKKSEKIDENPSITPSVMKKRRGKAQDEENDKDQLESRSAAEKKDEVEVDWDVRAKQRIEEVQKILESEEYKRYIACALVSDPTQPDPCSRLGKRVWKFQLEKWRRCVKKGGGKLPTNDNEKEQKKDGMITHSKSNGS